MMRNSRLVLVLLALAVGSQALDLELIPPQRATQDWSMVTTYVAEELFYYTNNRNFYKMYDGDDSTTFEITKSKGNPGMELQWSFKWKTRAKELIIKIAPDVSPDKYPRSIFMYAWPEPLYTGPGRQLLFYDTNMQFDANGVYRKKFSNRWKVQIYQLVFPQNNPYTIAFSEVQLIGQAGPYKKYFPDNKWPCSKQLSEVVPPTSGLFSFPTAVASRRDGSTSTAQGLPTIFNIYGIYKRNDWHQATFPGETQKVVVGATFDQPTEVLAISIRAYSPKRVQFEIQGSLCNPAVETCDLSGDAEWMTIRAKDKLDRHPSASHVNNVETVDQPGSYYLYRIIFTPVWNPTDGLITLEHIYFMKCDARR